jgi:hypothetical protein
VNPDTPAHPVPDRTPLDPGAAWRWFDVWSGLLPFLLYGLGVGHWVLFYHGGNFSLRLDDWKKEYDYYFILREALTQRRMPYHMSFAYHGTDRFLGMPETNLSPQIVLLPWLGIVPFFMWQTLILYTLGFVGCLLIRRRYRLGPTAFTLLFLLFSFNGYITSHLSCGHTMWNGYFLLPFFCLGTLRLLDGGSVTRPALLLGLVLFAMMLQGSFHHVNWCWLFLLLLAVFNPRLWRAVLVVVISSAALSALRLGPAVVALGRTGRGFWSGFPNVTYLIAGLVYYPEHDPSDAGAPWIRTYLVDTVLGWNEYDMYVGALGLAALVYFGIVRRLRCGSGRDESHYRGLDAPMLCMTFLSLNYFWWIIPALRVPLLTGETVVSRFFIIPLVFLMVLAAIHLQRFLQGVRPSAALYVLLIGGLVQTGCTLAEHSKAWQVIPASTEMPAVEPNDPSLIDRPDPVYVAVVHVSFAVSAAALLLWIGLMVRPRFLPLTVVPEHPG